MPVKTLREFLDQRRVMYSSIPHRTAFTSYSTAKAAHIDKSEFAKPVMVKVDGTLAMVVIPADERVDLDKLRERTRAKRVDLATEEEFAPHFYDCEAGAMPALGNLYGVPVILSAKLAKRARIAFNGGTHSELVQLSFNTYEYLTSPHAVTYAI